MRRPASGAATLLVAALLASVLTLVADPSPATAAEGGFVSDDFSAGLDPARWSVVDPVGDGTVEAVTDGDEHRLSLALPEGPSHDPWRTNRSLRAVQTIPDDDLDLAARFDSAPTQRFQMHGLQVLGPDGYVRFGVHHDGNDLRLYAATFVGTTPTKRHDTTIDPADARTLRITRTGDTWTLAHSPDGTTWTTATTFDHTLAADTAGVFAANHHPTTGTPAPAYTALVDYAFDTTTPIDPEDAVPPPADGFASDDFSGGLDRTRWSVVDPVGDGTVEAVSDGPCAAGVALAVPAGVAHDAWTTNQALRLVQPVEDDDLELSARFDSTPAQRFQLHGLVVEASATDYVRFTVHHDGGGLRLYGATFADGSYRRRLDAPVDAADARVLRLTRAGDSWTLAHSGDGTTWTTAATFSHALATTAAGVLAGNAASGGAAPPAYTALVDYAFDDQPIAPEDGGACDVVHPLTTTVSGAGSVTRSPDAAAYPPGTAVTLTAVPEPGWSFTGWSGAATGQDPTTTLTVAGPTEVSATFEPDSSPPVISDVAVEATSSSATLTWRTDDPSSSSVAHGPTTAYEGGTVDSPDLGTSHTVEVGGLAPATTYHLRITVTNASDQATTSDDVTVTTLADTAPEIDVWHGDTQTFGAIGQPQTWANVLGNVSDPDGVRSLAYTLNGGPSRPLSIGPDLRRLYGAGDFNVELAVDELAVGPNTLVLTAVDAADQVATRTVTVHRVAGTTWPIPYRTDWSSATSVSEQAQVVDGRWAVEDGTIRAVETGYDRTVAIGDLSWTDYEVEVPVTVHSLAPGWGTPQSGEPLVGLGLRWRGHTGSGAQQPRTGWYPTGAFAWYRWRDSGRYELVGNEGSPLARFTSPTVQFGTTYVLKAQVRTLGDGSAEYRFKVWPDGTAEPPAWSQTIVEADGPSSGSVLLIAHHVVADWGDVVVSPLAAP